MSEGVSASPICWAASRAACMPFMTPGKPAVRKFLQAFERGFLILPELDAYRRIGLQSSCWLQDVRKCRVIAHGHSPFELTCPVSLIVASKQPSASDVQYRTKKFRLRADPEIH